MDCLPSDVWNEILFYLPIKEWDTIEETINIKRTKLTIRKKLGELQQQTYK